MDVPKPCAATPPQPFSLKLWNAKPIICAQQPAVAAPPAKPTSPKEAQRAAEAAEHEAARAAARRSLIVRLVCVGAFSALVLALAVVLIRKLHKAGKC